MQPPPPTVPGPRNKATKPVVLVPVKPVGKATLAPQQAAPVQPMLIIVPPTKKPRPDASFHRKGRKLKLVGEPE